MPYSFAWWQARSLSWLAGLSLVCLIGNGIPIRAFGASRSDEIAPDWVSSPRQRLKVAFQRAGQPGLDVPQNGAAGRAGSNPLLPIPEILDPEAITHLEKELAAREPLIPRTPTAMSGREYNLEKKNWYRRNWVDSYREHADKAAAWHDMGHAFLRSCVESNGITLPAQPNEGLTAAVDQLLGAGCSDPLVRATALSMLPPDAPQRAALEKDLKADFLKSTYPVQLVYWNVFSFFTAEDLQLLQRARLGENRATWQSPFQTSNVLELRFLRDHLLKNLERNDSLGVRDVRPLENVVVILLADEEMSIWLRNMLLADYCLAGGLDDRILSQTLSEPLERRRVFPGAVEYRPSMHPLQREPVVVRRQSIARVFLLNAWHFLPSQPEAAKEMAAIHKRLSYASGAVPPGSPAFRIPNTEKELFATEDLKFWVQQALLGEIDSVETLHLLINRTTDLAELSHEELYHLGVACIDTNRFDTVLPLMYLETINNIDAANMFDPERRRAKYAGEDVRRQLQRLMDGYAKSPEGAGRYLPVLKSYMCCSLFLHGDIQNANRLLDEMGPNPKMEPFGVCHVTIEEIRSAAARMSGPIPFDLGPRAKIRWMEFVREGSQLVVLDEQKRLHYLDCGTGKSFPVNPPVRCDGAMVARDGQSVWTWSADGKASRRSLTDFSVIEAVETRDFPLPLPSGSLASLERQIGNRPPIMKVMEHDGKKLSLEMAREDVALLDVIGNASGSRLVSVTRRDRSRSGVWLNFQDVSGNRALARTQLFDVGFQQGALSRDEKWLAAIGSNSFNYRYDYPDGRTGEGWHALALADTETGDTRFLIRVGSAPTAMRFAMNDQLIAVATHGRTVELFSAQNGQPQGRIYGFSEAVTALAYDPATRILAAGGDDGRIQLCNLESFENVSGTGVPPEGDIAGFTLRVSRHSPVVLGVNGSESLLWRQQQGRVKAEASRGLQLLSALDGSTYVLSHRPFTWEGFTARPNLAVVDLQPAHRDGPAIALEIEVPADSRATQTLGGVRYLVPGYLPHLALHPGGRVIAVPGPAKHKMYNLETGKTLLWSELPAHKEAIDSIGFSGNGRRFATTYVNNYKGLNLIRVWDFPADPWSPGLPQLAPVNTLEVPLTGQWEGTQLNNDGSQLLIQQSGRVSVHQVANGKELFSRTGSILAVYSPAGDMLAVASNQKLELLNATDHTNIREFPLKIVAAVRDLQWRWDGKAVIFHDLGEVRCLDIDSGKSMSIFTAGAPVDSIVHRGPEHDFIDLFVRDGSRKYLKQLLIQKSGAKNEYHNRLQDLAPTLPIVDYSGGERGTVWNRFAVNGDQSGFGAFRFRVPPGEPKHLMMAFGLSNMTNWWLISVPGDHLELFDGLPLPQRPAGLPLPAGQELCLQVSRDLLYPGRDYLLVFTPKEDKAFDLFLAAGLLSPRELSQLGESQEAGLKALGIAP